MWQAVVHGANAVHPKVSSTGRLGYEQYNKLGYVPYDIGINESVARTLEYAYDDWCIYMLGRQLGKDQSEWLPFYDRAFNYKKVFDEETLLMRGRNADGSFQSPCSPLKWGDAFTEGNAWHYTWSVFHDPVGLIRLMGGTDVFVQMLDSVFNVPPLFDESYYGGVIHEIREMQIMNMGNYAHGNQPIQHMVYLYNYAGEPWKAQYWVREVMDRLYTAQPDGYCGDEDNGQTSAWYVFSAMGFYPVCPGSGQYVLGTPYFDKTTLHLPTGKTLVFQAFDNDSDNRYIGAMTFNGQPYDKNYLEHADILRGGVITYQMQSEPNRQRGIYSVPYSFSNSLILWEPYEHQPSFPGGASALLSFLQDNVHYPEEALKDSIQGKVVVTFIIEKDGSISNAQVVRGVHPLLDKEAVRVVGLMPKWNPAMSNGDYLRVKYSVPVVFKLNQPNSSQSLRPSEAHRE